MYTNLTHHKFFALKFVELHQLLQDILSIELFLSYFENIDFLVFHIRYVAIVHIWSDEEFVDDK